VKSNQQPVIVIKKAAHGKHAHHGGAWKVAYADFVTAMMAFFLVMWLVNASPKTKLGVASYFREPGVFETTSGGGGLMDGGPAGALPGGHPADVQAARDTLERAAERLREALAGVPDFAELKDRVEITITAEGLRIELLDNNDESFFAVGSSELSPSTVDLIRLIGVQLQGMKNPIAIEGHTDSRPYGSGPYDNWELSSDRASAARRILEAADLDPARIEAQHAYADARLRFPDDPLDARNRRIAIVVRQ
jgi:chemotaxis protein MotB